MESDHTGALRSFPVLVMVAAYSRFIAAVMIPSRVTGDLLAGMWQLLSLCIATVPRTLLWDNESGIGQRGRRLQVDVEVADLGALRRGVRDRGGHLMATKHTPAPGEADKLIAHQSRLLKAPRIAAHYARLTEQGRAAR